MIATLKFKLPKEKFEYRQATNGYRYAECLKEIKEYFDSHASCSKEKQLSAGLVQEMIKSIIEDNLIYIDEL